MKFSLFYAYLVIAMPSLINFTVIYLLHFFSYLLLFFVFLIISKNFFCNVSINPLPSVYEASNFSQCFLCLLIFETVNIFIYMEFNQSVFSLILFLIILFLYLKTFSLLKVTNC